jgi:hypothetical protein
MWEGEPTMNQQTVAIIIAGGLIAAAIAFTNHWSVIGDPNSPEGNLARPSGPLDRLSRHLWAAGLVACVENCVPD